MKNKATSEMWQYASYYHLFALFYSIAWAILNERSKS